MEHQNLLALYRLVRQRVFTHNFLLPAIHGQTGALTVRVDRLWYTHNSPGTKSVLLVIEQIRVFLKESIHSAKTEK